MALTTNSMVWKILFSIFFIITILFVILFYFEELFVTFLIAIVLVFVVSKLRKVYLRFCNHFNFPQIMNRIVGSLLLILLFVGIYYLFKSAVVSLSDVFTNNKKISLDLYSSYLSKYLPYHLGDAIDTKSALNKLQLYIFEWLSEFLATIPSYFLKIILIVPMVFYMYFKKGNEIIENIFLAVPSKFHIPSRRAFNKIVNQLKDFTNAKFYESFIVAFICVIGFYFVGLNGWLFFGILAGILNIIPYLGPLLGAIPPVVISLVNSPLSAFYVLLVIIIAQLIDNLYVIPFYISHRVKIDPLLSIVLILVGAKIFGALGMIMAIPIYLIYKIVLEEAYVELLGVYERKPKSKKNR